LRMWYCVNLGVFQLFCQRLLWLRGRVLLAEGLSLTSETTSSAGENLQGSAVFHYKHDAQASESSAFPIPTRLRFELVWLAPFRGLPQATGSAGGH